MGILDDAEQFWNQLADRTGRPQPATFDLSTVDSLPAPARRWLTRALPPNTPLDDTIELTMTGRILIMKRWLPFTARQIVRAGVGLVWIPVVGGRVLRFVGADIVGPDLGRMEFRLHGRIRLVAASGRDVARSGAGRLAAETVAWLPQAATPQAGASWTPIDEHRARVTIDAAGEKTEVEIEIAGDGRLRSLVTSRWNSDADPPGREPFGADIATEHRLANGVRIAGVAAAGWGHGTAAWDDGEFFRYRLTNAEVVGTR